MASDISRRDFIKTTSAAATGVGAAAVSPIASPRAKEQDNQRVVIAKDTECITDSSGNVDEERIQDMVDHAIIALTGINNTSKAYENLFSEPVTSSTTIAIKKNSISGKTSKSYPVVLNALKKGLAKMLDGTFPEDNVIITTGKDGTTSPTNPSFYIDDKYEYIIKDIWVQSDWIIDVPVCWANNTRFGVTLSLKNMMSALGGSDLSNICERSENPKVSIIVLNSQPTFKEKRILTLIDAVMGRSASGPGGSCDYKAHSVIASRDTLAADYCGIQILSNFELSTSLKNIGLETLEIAANDPYNIGTADPDLMDIVEVEAPWDPTGIKSGGTKQKSAPGVTTKTSGSQVAFTLRNVKGTPVELSLFDLQGREIWTFNGAYANTIVWQGRDQKGNVVSNGSYVYRLKSGGQEVSGLIKIF